jgi:hypothetical protein
MGATPTIVPFSLLGIAGPAAPGGGGAEATGAPGRGAGAGGAPCAEGWFIMSIVPLNFGAATLFR